MNDNEKNKLIKTTIEVLKYTTFNPIVLKILDVIGRIIQKGKYMFNIKVNLRK